MFLNIFLLKIISVFFSADLLITHVSAPYVTTESVTVLYGWHLVALDIFLDFSHWLNW